MTYVARYGHQQRSEIRAMPVSVLWAWIDDLNELIRAENGGDK